MLKGCVSVAKPQRATTLIVFNLKVTERGLCTLCSPLPLDDRSFHFTGVLTQ